MFDKKKTLNPASAYQGWSNYMEKWKSSRSRSKNCSTIDQSLGDRGSVTFKKGKDSNIEIILNNEEEKF